MPNAKGYDSVIGSQRKLSTGGPKVPYKYSYSTNYEEQQIIETLVVIPPDGGWGWMCVFVSFCCSFIADGIMYSFGLFLDDISVSLKCEPTQVAVANSVMTGIYYLSGPFVSALTNRFGFRGVAVVGGLMASSTLLLTSLSDRIITVIGTYGVIGGMGFGMVYMPSVIVIGFYFERWRALASCIAVCGSSLGIVCFPPIFTYFLKNFHWRDKFRILAAVMFVCACLTFSYRPLKPIRVLAVSDKHAMDRMSMCSAYVEDLGNRKFSRYHNLGYPTTATLHSGSTITIVEPRRLSIASTIVGVSLPSSSVSWASAKRKGERPKLGKVVEEDEEVDDETAENRCRKCCGKCKGFLCCCRVRADREVEESQGTCRRWFKWLQTCLCCCWIRREEMYASRPLYRDDIFYSGSLLVLPEYKRTAGSAGIGYSISDARMDYHLSVTRIATQRDLEEDYDRCVFCGEAIKRTLATMLDMTILKSPSFLLVCFSGFFTMLGLFIPVMFVVERARINGMDVELASYLLSVFGIFNTLGRIISGILLCIPHINALRCSYVGLFVCGIITCISHLSYETKWQYAYVAVYGLNICTVAALRHLIFIDLLGLEKLTNSFGIGLVFQGVACLIGIPTAGALKEWTGSYVLPFIFSGSVLLFSAVLLLPVRVINLREKAAQGLMSP